VRKAAPDKGAETDEVLKEFGYSEAEITKLKAAGVTAGS
jgi:crotonobetainyl-CoA:carnitine CoA-transferase CaiB-like acyl-CoA transferase